MYFRTVSQMNDIVIKNIEKIPRDIDLIVGIPRSGMLPATMISLYLNLPLTDVNSLKNGHLYQNGITKINKNWKYRIEDCRRILIVEDSSASGNSIINIKNELKEFAYNDKLVFLAVFATSETKKIVDLYFDICPVPRMFEWNCMHHVNLKNCCVDIDGVLCADPTDSENDDGEKYKKFLLNTLCKTCPTFPIGALVTCRLEKYRQETEFWLEKNKIQYEKLIMMNCKTKQERINLGSHGKYKAIIYKSDKEKNLFIESDQEQAEIIAKISGKAVFCVENQIYYQGQYCHYKLAEYKCNIYLKMRKYIGGIIRKFKGNF